MVWIDFHCLLGDHVGAGGGVSQSLCFHNSFHVSGPSILTCDENARRVRYSLAHLDFFDFVTKDFFDEFAKWFEGGLLLFELLLLVFGVVKF